MEKRSSTKTVSRRAASSPAAGAAPKRRAGSRVKAAPPVATGHLIPEHIAVSPTRRVGVRFFAPDAKQVFLAGTFNAWKADATPLQPRGEGLWETELELKPGDYEYRFVADGQWATDPMAPRFVANPFGELNDVLHVA